jgi:HEAT repeat protein
MSGDEAGRAETRRRIVVAGHTGDISGVRAYLGDTDPQLRELALGALERAGGLRAEELVRGLTDPAAVVRRRAAELAARRPGDVEPSLVPVLADPDASVVEVAAWACGEREPAEPGVVAVLVEIATEHEDALCREAAVAALGSLGDPGGKAAVVAATRDKPAVRRRAVLALVAFDGPDVDAALARAREDRDWQVRQAAEDVAG